MASLDASTIIVTIVTLGNAWAIGMWMDSRLQRRAPIMTPENKVDVLDKSARKKSAFRIKWFFFFCELVIIIYVLSEVLRPGELDRLFVYKIVIGVGFFFFLLIQASISNAFYGVYKMKKVDWDLIKKILDSLAEKDKPSN